jgi:hypothetical protein
MRVRALLLAAVAATASLVTLPGAASAACASPSTKYLGGTVWGSDNLDVTVQLGFSILDSYGKSIGLDGCRISGYSTNLFINTGRSHMGYPHTSATKNTWKLTNLPSNAVKAWIEAWPRDASNNLNYSKYGGAMRRSVAINRGDVRVILPVNCANGGRTGVISGRAYNKAGAAVTVTRLYAWTEVTDSGSYAMGFGPGKFSGSSFSVPSLASGQYYTVLITGNGYPTKRIEKIPVQTCKTTPLRVVFG